MDTRELFTEYFGEFEKTDRMYETVCENSVEGGEPQLIMDLKAYCMTQRVFLEQFHDDGDGLKATLLLFPLPAMHPAFSERMSKKIAYEWSDIWMKHLSALAKIFERDDDSKRLFLWHLIHELEDYEYWMNGLDNVFVEKSAEDCYPALESIVRDYADGFADAESLMADLREDGFTPELPYYQGLESRLLKVLVKIKEESGE